VVEKSVEVQIQMRRRKNCFPQRRKDAKEARKALNATRSLRASALRLCAFAGNSFLMIEISQISN
jgi:hypothetical protein